MRKNMRVRALGESSPPLSETPPHYPGGVFYMHVKSSRRESPLALRHATAHPRKKRTQQKNMGEFMRTHNSSAGRAPQLTSES